MESDLAKKVAGTYVEDAAKALPGTIAYLTKELREGSLREHAKKFVEEQPEFLDAGLVLVESVANDVITCCIPFKADDHESPHTFESNVQFTLNLLSGQCTRI